MEGASRFIHAYNLGNLQKCCVATCKCCADRDEYDRKLFRGKYLKVIRAPDPSLILWENLHVTSAQRCCRVLFSTIIALTLLVLTTMLILWIKLQEEDYKADSKSCTTEDSIT